jgi:hypothetical protein
MWPSTGTSSCVTWRQHLAPRGPPSGAAPMAPHRLSSAASAARELSFAQPRSAAADVGYGPARSATQPLTGSLQGCPEAFANGACPVGLRAHVPRGLATAKSIAAGPAPARNRGLLVAAGPGPPPLVAPRARAMTARPRSAADGRHDHSPLTPLPLAWRKERIAPVAARLQARRRGSCRSAARVLAFMLLPAHRESAGTVHPSHSVLHTPPPARHSPSPPHRHAAPAPRAAHVARKHAPRSRRPAPWSPPRCSIRPPGCGTRCDSCYGTRRTPACTRCDRAECCTGKRAGDEGQQPGDKVHR